MDDKRAKERTRRRLKVLREHKIPSRFTEDVDLAASASRDEWVEENEAQTSTMAVEDIDGFDEDGPSSKTLKALKRSIKKEVNARVRILEAQEESPSKVEALLPIVKRRKKTGHVSPKDSAKEMAAPSKHIDAMREKIRTRMQQAKEKAEMSTDTHSRTRLRILRDQAITATRFDEILEEEAGVDRAVGDVLQRRQRANQESGIRLDRSQTAGNVDDVPTESEAYDFFTREFGGTASLPPEQTKRDWTAPVLQTHVVGHDQETMASRMTGWDRLRKIFGSAWTSGPADVPAPATGTASPQPSLGREEDGAQEKVVV